MELEVRERISDYLLKERITGAKLANVLNVNRVTLQSKLNGTRGIDLDTLCMILGYFPKLSAEWLMRGQGEMYKSDEVTPNISVQGNNNHTANIYGSLDAKDKEIEMLRAELKETKDRCNKYWEMLTKMMIQK